MKNLLIILLLFLFSCNSKTFESESKKLNDKIKLELNSNKVNNDILLDFKFGMSKSECENLTLGYLSSGKFYNEDNFCFYTMYDEYKSIFLTDYLDNRLITLKLIIKDYQTPAEFIKKDLSNKFSNKYGIPIEVPVSNSYYDDDYNYYFVSGNLLISIEDEVIDMNNFYVVKYEDLRFKFKKSAENKKIELEKNKKDSLDFINKEKVSNEEI